MGWRSRFRKYAKAFMSALDPEDAGSGEHRPRPRANTSFLAWRRNMPDATPTSLASTPAIPIQTLPIDTLIQLLEPPSEPSLAHARSLVTALSTQTPAPPPADLLPIISSLCAIEAPPSVQAAGFDVFCAFCSCGSKFDGPDRSAYFDVLQRTGEAEWCQEVWEPRLKALNALLPSAEDAERIEMDVLRLLRDWAGQAFKGYWEDGSEFAEREAAFEGLSHALAVWFDVFDSCSRLHGDDLIFPYEFYEELIDSILQMPVLPTLPSQHSFPSISTPASPQRETKHRRHPSSAVSISSPLSGHSRGPLHQPVDFIVSLYLNFLKERLARIPLSQLSTSIPLLFRTLASIMSELSTLSPVQAKRKTTEHRIAEALGALLWGSQGTTCLDILRQSLAPRVGSTSTQIKESTGAVRALRLQIRLVLEDRMAARMLQRNAALSATPAGAPALSPVLESNLIDRARRAWSKESSAMWDARKVSYFLVKAVKSWNQTGMTQDKEVIFAEMAGLLKDVLFEMDDRAEDREGTSNTDYDDNVTGSAVGRALAELVKCVKDLK